MIYRSCRGKFRLWEGESPKCNARNRQPKWGAKSRRHQQRITTNMNHVESCEIRKFLFFFFFYFSLRPRSLSFPDPSRRRCPSLSSGRNAAGGGWGKEPSEKRTAIHQQPISWIFLTQERKRIETVTRRRKSEKDSLTMANKERVTRSYTVRWIRGGGTGRGGTTCCK